MNGFALLVAASVLGQTGGVGWEVDKEDNKLQYIIHLTPQDVANMQQPGTSDAKEEIVLNVPPSLQGKFAKIVVRVDPSMPPRLPVEDQLRMMPSLVPTASALSQGNGSGPGFAQVDRDRNETPIRNAGGGTTSTLSDVSQNRNPATSPLLSGTRDRDRDAAPAFTSPTASLSSAQLNPPGTPMQPLNRDSSGFANPATGMGAGGLGTGALSSNRDPSSLGSGTSTGFGTPASTMDNHGIGGSNLGSGSNLNGTSTYGNNTGSMYTNPSYASTNPQTGALVNPSNTILSPMGPSSGFGNTAYNNNASNVPSLYNGYGSSPGAYQPNGPYNSGFGGQGLGSGALTGPDYRMASNPVSNPVGTVGPAPISVPFPETSSSAQAMPPRSQVTNRVNTRDTYDSSRFLAENQQGRISYLPILFLLSIVVNFYAGIYLYKLRDRYRALLASVRTGIDP